MGAVISAPCELVYSRGVTMSEMSPLRKIEMLAQGYLGKMENYECSRDEVIEMFEAILHVAKEPQTNGFDHRKCPFRDKCLGTHTLNLPHPPKVNWS